MEKRTKSLLKFLNSKKLDACFIKSEDNLFYFLDKRIEGALVITPGEQIVISDKRYKEELSRLPGKFTFLFTRNYLKALKSVIKKYKIKTLGFEEEELSFSLYERIKSSRVEMVPIGSDIDIMRMVKTPEEIQRIKEALYITGQTFLFLRDILSVGQTEKFLESEILRFSLLKGAEEPSFPPIVLSGKRTSLVHGRPSSKKVAADQPLLVDFGVRFNGYCSDLTRIFALGRIPAYIKDTVKIVLDAQEIAFKSIREGQFLSSVEKKVRKFFKKHKKERFFYHSLGHGLGINIHEKPFFSLQQNTELREGMVVTVEPGLYFEGRYGVRIEDVVLVKKNGVEILSGYIDKSV